MHGPTQHLLPKVNRFRHEHSPRSGSTREDPVCLIAEFASAVVGLVAAGAKAGNSLYSFIDTLKDAPNEFLALSDEVTDFRAILARLVEAQDSGEFDTKDRGHLDVVRSKGDDILKKIDSLVAKVKKDGLKGGSGENGNANQVDRIRWLRKVRKAKKLQESLRTLKGSICNFIVLGMLLSLILSVDQSARL